MSQIILGAALGSIAGQGLVFGAQRLVGWLQRDKTPDPTRNRLPLRGHALALRLLKYAGVLAISAALITFAVWNIRDYLAARTASRVARAELLTPATTTPLADPRNSSDEAAGSGSGKSSSDEDSDPYSDPRFKAPRRPHRSGTPLSLKETLVQRAEARAGADLLQETQQHAQRSQYDCEAAERAGKYLKAGLDVWGFATWQVKYFPTDHYEGATLPQCKAIRNVLDPSRLDLQSTVAAENPR